MRQIFELAAIALCSVMAMASTASATCPFDRTPNSSQLTDLRTNLVTVRAQAQAAARDARAIEQYDVAQALEQLAVGAVRNNAASYSSSFSCGQIAGAKSDAISAESMVNNAADMGGMSQFDQDRILGPVHDALEALNNCCGVPTAV